MKLIAFLKEIFTLARAGRSLFFLLVILTIAGTLAAVPGPFLFTWLIDNINAGLELRHAIYFVLGILGLQTIEGIIGIIRVHYNKRFALDAANQLRDDFFAKLLHLPYSFFLSNNAGGQANSYLNDIDDIDQAISEFIDVGLKSFLAILFFGTAIIIWNPIIGLFALIVLPITVFAQRKIRSKVAMSSRNKVDLREDIVSAVSEAVNTIDMVKSFTLEGEVECKVHGISDDFRRNDIVMETYQSMLRSTASVLLIFVQYSFFVIGAIMVVRGQLGVGSFLGQILLLGRFIGPLNSLLEYVNTLNKCDAALDRVRGILALDEEGSAHERTVAALPDSSNGVSLQLSDLHFRYTEELPLIEGWNVDIEAGQTVAIVGPSGCGKTTLFQLLLGLFNNYTGTIAINGQDLAETQLSAIREKTGVVFQEHILFNASIRDNLMIGVPEKDQHSVTDDDLWDVLQMAHAKEFIENLDDGLNSLVGENGVKLSGGQRQRLALARVILKNPPLLLLDEATSALDSFSEVHIQKALNELFQNRTSIIIAHRLSTITHADKIIVIEKNKVKQQGTHAELIEAEGIYKKLYEAQIHGFVNWDTLSGGDE